MTDFNKKFDVKLNLHIEVTYYRPARPAPDCSDPDHAAFCDPGNNVELEFVIYLLTKEGEKKPLPQDMDFLYEELFDEVLEDFENEIYLTHPFEQ